MRKQDNIDNSNLQEYIEHIRFVPVDSNPDMIFEKICHRIKNGKTLILGVSPVWKYISVAASIALLIVSSLFVIATKKTDTIQMSYLEVQSVSGSKTRVVLPDSSVVWLNSKASIRYPQQFTGQNREVEFTGEALFSITKNKEMPFIVVMNGMKLEVLGTVFNIHSDMTSDIIETTLLEGSVAVFSENNTTGKADAILLPNEQALYNRSSGDMKVRDVSGILYSAWVSGVFRFENNTLEDIMRTLSRAFDVSIHIKSKSLGEKKFTAQFFHHETLDEILSVLQISAKYKYEKIKGEIYITDK